MNLTDVDDRIIGEAGKQGVPIRDFTSPFAEAFHADRDFLRVQDAEEYPRATDFIEPMVRLVEGLLANGDRLPRRRWLDLLLDRAVSRVRPAVAARPARAQGRRERAGRERRVRQGGRARLRPLEGGKARGRSGRARPGMRRSAGAGPGWHLECSAMALELIGAEVRRRRARHPRRRGGPDLSRITRTRSRSPAPSPARPISRGSGCTASS